MGRAWDPGMDHRAGHGCLGRRRAFCQPKEVQAKVAKSLGQERLGRLLSDLSALVKVTRLC